MSASDRLRLCECISATQWLSAKLEAGERYIQVWAPYSGRKVKSKEGKFI